MKIDGSIKESICNGYVGEKIIISNGWIYYIAVVNDSGSFYRMKLDGTSKQKLSDNPINEFSVNNNYIFFSNIEDVGKLYRMNLDGTNCLKINNEQTEGISVNDTDVFYVTKTNNGTGILNIKICRIGIDGNNRTTIFEQKSKSYAYITGINIIDDFIYFHYLNYHDDNAANSGFFRALKSGNKTEGINNVSGKN
jgi:hypothetical protein